MARSLGGPVVPANELAGPRGAGYRRMLEQSPAGGPETPDGAFITGSDFLMGGGVTASYFFGELAG